MITVFPDVRQAVDDALGRRQLDNLRPLIEELNGLEFVKEMRAKGKDPILTILISIDVFLPGYGASRLQSLLEAAANGVDITSALAFPNLIDDGARGGFL